MIIVTGGCGFIGSNLVKKIHQLQLGEICIVDEQGKILQCKKELAPYTEEFIDYQTFLQNLNCLKRGDIVFHQGACTDTMNYDSLEMMYKNFEYSKRLFDYCRIHHIRLIYASSAAVYGMGENGFREEIECERPINLYAQSKLLFDNYVRCFKPSTQVVGLRYFNVYGPGEENKGRMASTIYQFYNQLSQTKEVRPFKNSDEYKRDFIYIDDVLNINLHFYKNPKISGIFNCGTGKSRSFMAIINIMKSYFNFQITEIEKPKGLLSKYQTFTEADLDKLREAGYKEKILTLSEGISRYIRAL